MTQSNERLLDLLSDRATGDLMEHQELATLLVEHPNMDNQTTDMAAAAAALAMLDIDEDMPSGLADQILADAPPFLADNLYPMTPKTPVSQTVSRSSEKAVEDTRGQGAPPSANIAWFVAAALLIAALIGWLPREQEKELTLSEQFAALSEQSGNITLDFGKTEDAYAAGATGRVVWNTAEQKGFMEIEGLHANDASVDQYQLWIFDKAQDERYPIDGGVFDMTAGKALIPIDAKINVDDPFLFAITVEKPGGVVVSSRERIVLLAQTAAN